MTLRTTWRVFLFVLGFVVVFLSLESIYPPPPFFFWTLSLLTATFIQILSVNVFSLQI